MTQLRSAYNVDVALCIDGTAGMLAVLDTIKEQARSLRTMFERSLADRGRVGRLRVRVIVFRDYAYDGEDAMMESDFFDLDDPSQEEAFAQYLDDIEAFGGGDLPENALEAIALALRSPWTTEGGRFRRHVTMLFTDAPARALQDPACTASPCYPHNMPANLEELYQLFTQGDPVNAPCYSPDRARLIVFAPVESCSAWDNMKTWERTWVAPISPDISDSIGDMSAAMSVQFNTF